MTKEQTIQKAKDLYPSGTWVKTLYKADINNPKFIGKIDWKLMNKRNYDSDYSFSYDLFDGLFIIIFNEDNETLGYRAKVYDIAEDEWAKPFLNYAAEWEIIKKQINL